MSGIENEGTYVPAEGDVDFDAVMEAAVERQRAGEVPATPDTPEGEESPGVAVAPDDVEEEEPADEPADDEETEEVDDVEEEEPEEPADDETAEDDLADEEGVIRVGDRTFKTPEELAAYAAGLQSVVGRQGAELGSKRDLERELDELKAQLAQRQQEPAQPELYPPSPQVVGHVEAIAEEGDFQEALDFIVGSMDTSQPRTRDLYYRVLGDWQTTDPGAATRYHDELRAQAQSAEVEQRTAPLTQEATLQQQRSAIASAYTSLNEETKGDSAQYQQAMIAFAQNPDNAETMKALGQLPPEKLVRSLYQLVKGDPSSAKLTEAVVSSREETRKKSAAKRKAASGLSATNGAGSKSTKKGASFEDKAAADLAEVDPARAEMARFRASIGR